MILQTDSETQRQASVPRKAVQVAVAVLLRRGESGQVEFFLTSRPAGKPYTGYWEFAGGKLEAGESVEQALVRELREELDLTIELADVQRWRSERVDYPHALVDLHFCQVWRWQGEPVMLEGQQGAWQSLPVNVSPVLPGTLPVLQWLAAEFSQEKM